MNFLELPSTLEKEIYEAFEGVQLGDGIGYFEADAIDGYLGKDSAEYQAWKEKDERLDWKKLVPLFEKDEGDMQVLFMDAKGLHYYLPVFLLAGTSLNFFCEKFLDAMDSPPLPEEADEWTQWNRQKYFTLKALLSAPRAGLRPARPPRGSRKLGAARRFLESPAQKRCLLGSLEYLAD